MPYIFSTILIALILITVGLFGIVTGFIPIHVTTYTTLIK